MVQDWTDRVEASGNHDHILSRVDLQAVVPELLDKFQVEMRHFDIAVTIGVLHVVDIDEEELQHLPDEPVEMFPDEIVRVEAAVHRNIFNWFRRSNWFWRLRGGGQLDQKSLWNRSRDPFGFLGFLSTKALIPKETLIATRAACTLPIGGTAQ